MSKKGQNAISPTRSENYSEWYLQVIKAADLAEHSPARGCMVIKPWGYALWENIQKDLDARFKETGHRNAYFPLFIPLSYLEKEAEHVEGFAKECAVVTHHRLEPNGKGGLKPTGELEEPYIVRPTSEMIIGEMYSRWVQSYRDLPILINQWANVVRWEMRTRLFLRTAEFLWQEGHTVHATSEEAMEETLKMLQVYKDFCYEFLAFPVIDGEKTPDERFPGADHTFTIEGMMQDGKALQSGTSHFLGQNFSKAQNIKFLNDQSEEEFAWTTSWGVSTRLIGGLIMTHSDDDGLVLPPKVAPEQIVILPIYRKPEDRDKVLAYCKEIQTAVISQRFGEEKIRIMIDDRDMRGGEKVWQHIKKGVPVRLEIGPKDMEKNSVFMGRRDLTPKDKKSVDKDEFIANITSYLEDIQKSLLEKATKLRDERIKEVSTFDELKSTFEGGHAGFVLAPWCENDQMEDMLKPLGVTARCIPLNQEKGQYTCIFSGKPTDKKAYFAKAY
jgi:prolyl-tRNA synthetase